MIHLIEHPLFYPSLLLQWSWERMHYIIGRHFILIRPHYCDIIDKVWCGDVRILDDDVENFWFLRNEVEEFYSYRYFLWMWIVDFTRMFFFKTCL